jgi:imidazolonepropionase-like amidohydrolase
MLGLLLAVQVQAVAFEHAELVRTDRPGVLHDQTVIVQGDRIAWVGATAEARLPPGTRRIDARGQYLLPTFADMHVHLGRREDLVTYVANGITMVRNMWGTPRDLAWRDSIKAGTLAGPRIVTAGPILDGDPPSIPQMTVLTDVSQARAEVQRQSQAGYDFIKVYNSLPAAVYGEIVRSAREARLPVAGHVPFSVGIYAALNAGQRSIEHLRGYIAELVPPGSPVQPGASLRSRSVAWNYVDTTRFAKLVEATVRAGTWNDPTLMVTPELLAPPDRWDSLAARPVLRYLGPGAQGDRSKIPYLQDFTAADYRASLQGLDTQRKLVRALHHAGARLLAGTDSYLQGFALQLELEELAASGLEPWDVLMIATRNPALYFDEAGQWGVVAPGARADLQLIGSDPLASISALNDRRGVMLRGEWLSRQELQRRLEDIAR